MTGMHMLAYYLLTYGVTYTSVLIHLTNVPGEMLDQPRHVRIQALQAGGMRLELAILLYVPLTAT